jgi:hypothetical protein
MPMPTKRRVNPTATAVKPKATTTDIKRKMKALGASDEETQDGDERFMKDDAELDRRIIEGMLHDRDGLMRDMKGRGFSNASVLRRAAELGLSEAMIRQVKGVVADLAGERPTKKTPPPNMGARVCLCCDRIFLSAGPGNRLCMRCRGGDAGLAAL